MRRGSSRSTRGWWCAPRPWVTRRRASRSAPTRSELERVVEQDGKRYLLRPVRPEDESLLIAGFARMTPEDVRMRFFAPIKTMTHAMAARLTQIDYHREIALGLLDAPGEGTEAYGIVRLNADPEFETAEFAVTVLSGVTGRGFGRLLLEAIIDYARGRGIGLVYGDALADNRRMIGLARDLGFSVRSVPDEHGIVRLELALRPRGS